MSRGVFAPSGGSNRSSRRPLVSPDRAGGRAANRNRSIVARRAESIAKALDGISAICGAFICNCGTIVHMAVSDPPTTITIRSSTRRLLESMKRPDETYDELLQELAEEYYPEAVVDELRRRVTGLRRDRVKTVPASEAYQRLGV